VAAEIASWNDLFHFFAPIGGVPRVTSGDGNRRQQQPHKESTAFAPEMRSASSFFHYGRRIKFSALCAFFSDSVTVNPARFKAEAHVIRQNGVGEALAGLIRLD
jgi:hypothetical protein